MKIRITWEVDDGYAGGSRPHYTTINTLDYVDTDAEWEALSEDEREVIIYDAIQQDFEQRIGFYIKSKEVVER